MCSSLGGKNCIIQHPVSSHSVGGRPVLIRLKSLKDVVCSCENRTLYYFVLRAQRKFDSCLC